MLLPREALVGQLRDVGHRLADGHEALAEHLVAVAEADVAALERRRVDGPAAAVLDDGPLLPERPGAVAVAL